jgi:hypothetical protein
VSASDDSAGRSITVRFGGVVRRARSLIVVEGPPVLLGELNVKRLRLRIGSASGQTYVFRLRDRTVVVLPEQLCAAAGVDLGAWVEARASVRIPRLERQVPADVRAALEAAGADIAALSFAERRQSLMLIGEAKGVRVRRARIEALVNACLARAAGDADVEPLPVPRRRALPAEKVA